MEPALPDYTVLTMIVNTIKANGITSPYSRQPRTVTSSYKYGVTKKGEKANPF